MPRMSLSVSTSWVTSISPFPRVGAPMVGGGGLGDELIGVKMPNCTLSVGMIAAPPGHGWAVRPSLASSTYVQLNYPVPSLFNTIGRYSRCCHISTTYQVRLCPVAALLCVVV